LEKVEQLGSRFFSAAGFHAVFDVVDAGEPLLTPLAFQILTFRGAWHFFRPKAWLDSKPITGFLDLRFLLNLGAQNFGNTTHLSFIKICLEIQP